MTEAPHDPDRYLRFRERLIRGLAIQIVLDTAEGKDIVGLNRLITARIRLGSDTAVTAEVARMAQATTVPTHDWAVVDLAKDAIVLLAASDAGWYDRLVMERQVLGDLNHIEDGDVL
ncbi:hypothetical protein [Frondihabitans cladoniiphilus]|uniref:Uncharacterized protein n=1 Tax=Frondihabitans cladoniiphilus TaxID=715785 RepID=A0ABP8WDP0_9MICO